MLQQVATGIRTATIPSQPGDVDQLAGMALLLHLRWSPRRYMASRTL